MHIRDNVFIVTRGNLITDEVIKGTVITQGGNVVHEATQKAMQPAAARA